MPQGNLRVSVCYKGLRQNAKIWQGGGKKRRDHRLTSLQARTFATLLSCMIGIFQKGHAEMQQTADNLHKIFRI